MARAKVLTAEQRREISRKAANTRWNKRRKVGFGMSEPSPTHKHVASLLVAAKQLLDQAQVDPSIDTQISFYAIRTQVDTALSTVLDPQHHGLMDLRQMLSIPTLDVMIRIVGLLQGVVNDYEAGVLKEFPPMPIWGPRFG